MPTHGDETLHDRYAREHADHLARLAKMTPEQIAEMELSLHNALAEVDRLRARLHSQGGEAVEVVARATGGLYVGFDIIRKPEQPVAVITHPSDQVADGVVVSRELVERIASLCMYTLSCADYDELRQLLAKSEGVKP